MIQIEIQDEDRPRHRLELKYRGHLDNIREGPYITHNLLVTHAAFLKEFNKDKKLNLYRISPFGGGFNYIGDICALLTWYFVVVYIIVAFPLACYCENEMVNITNTIVLCVIVIYHIIAAYGVTKNRKKFRRAYYVAETSAEKYMGLQNYFLDLNINNLSEQHLINSTQKKKIIAALSKREDKNMVLMLCTKSYWRNSVIDPIICLTIVAVVSFAGMFVQIITLKT